MQGFVLERRKEGGVHGQVPGAGMEFPYGGHGVEPGGGEGAKVIVERFMDAADWDVGSVASPDGTLE